MKITCLRKNEKDEIVEYELKIYNHEISCLYQDRYGVYVATIGGKLHKTKHTLEELDVELNGISNRSSVSL